ncbi:IS630 transposase-related protein [Candidatus Fukatsuia symbiotica]|uniref:IS630 transposase-related protein n=1 Tax=Candidatus Fukatsuia TaxID=1927833 RepID=UPI001967BE72|nr:IS630 transposase-related protein [Candidatus Fukatsuia symbiotica]MEA9445990.1 IS630 transposase-related protein [Candidatus Fukatsuia symbiotica]
MSYSVDFRRKVLSVREQEGLSIRATAKRFHIGTDSLTRWLRRIEPQQSGSCRRKKKALVKDVELYPDACQRECGPFWGVHEIHLASLEKMGHQL